MKKFLFILLLLPLFFFERSSLFVRADSSAVELVNLRSENTKVFSLSNGQKEVVYYDVPVHYLNSGSFVEIDNSLSVEGNCVSTGNSNYRARMEDYRKHKIELSYLNHHQTTIDFNDDYFLGMNNEDISYQISVPSAKTVYNEATNLSSYIDISRNSIQLSRVLFEPHRFIKSIGYHNMMASYNVGFTISTQFNVVISDEAVEFKSDEGEIIYSIKESIIIDSIGNVFTSKMSVEQESENAYQFSMEFNDEEINTNATLPMISYTSVENIENQISIPVNYKHIVKGSTSDFKDMYLKVGKEISPIVDPFGNTDITEYIGIFGATIPSNFFEDTITKAEFSLKKYNGYGNPVCKLINTDKKFTEIDGLTSYSTSFSISPSVSSDIYTYNITPIINSLTENRQNEILLALTLSSTQVVQFYCALNQKPTMSFTTTSDHISLYGNAKGYVESTNSNQNCFGYILGIVEKIQIENWDMFTSIPKFTELRYPELIGKMEDRLSDYYEVRPLIDKTALIAPYERKIAFSVAVQNGKLKDFHFMQQISDGRWSHKPGIFNSEIYTFGEIDEIWQLFFTYNMPVVFYAISAK